MTDEYLFISDCHLDGSRPEITRNLVDFIKNRASTARFLYILGDLFEVWLGDDDPVPGFEELISSLKQLSQTTKIYFLAGNRDFLLGDEFAGRAGLNILLEPVKLNLDGQSVVLLHGDVLCTDDHDYQAFRKQVRDPDWQSNFLLKPLTERQQIAAGLRADSIAATLEKIDEITDTNQDAVDACFDRQAAEIMIHGHTHRPCIHQYSQSRTRYVLGDWNPVPSYLSWNKAAGFKLHDPRSKTSPHVA
jgi:UDP-2,3-diacylglucosamine hydrolase